LTPILDPRRADELLADLYRRRAGYVPTFEPTPGGPGAALLRIAADQLAALVERLDQAPDKRGLALLDLVGVGLVPARPARAPVVFSATPGVASATAPAGTRLGAQVPGRADPLVFETESTIAVGAAQLVEITSVDPGHDAYAAHAGDLAAGRSATLFAGATRFAHELYIGHATSFAFAGRVRVEIELTLRRAATEALALAADWWDGTAWRAFAAFEDDAGDEDSHDGTDGLQRGGIVRLVTACAHSQFTVVDGVSSHWVRLAVTSPLSPGAPAGLPVVDRLEVRSIVEHRRVLQTIRPSSAGSTLRVWDALGNVAPGRKVTVEDLVAGAAPTMVTSADPEIALPVSAGRTVALALADAPTADDYCDPFTVPATSLEVDLAMHRGLPLDKGVSDGRTLDLTKSFQPLGPTPDVGAALYLACADVFTKPGAEVTLVLDRPTTVQEEAEQQGHMYEIEINAAKTLVEQIEQRLGDIASALDVANAALAAPLPDLVKSGDSTDIWHTALKTALNDVIAALTATVTGGFTQLLNIVNAGLNAILNPGSWKDAVHSALSGARELGVALRELGAVSPGLDTAIHDADTAIAADDAGKMATALVGLNLELAAIAGTGAAFLGAMPSFLATKPEDYVAAVLKRIADAVAAFTTAAAQIRSVVIDLKNFNPAALVAASGGSTPQLGAPHVAWEAFDGDRWLPVDELDGTTDDARNLVGSGKVRFVVPDWWAECEVAGDTRRWLRARLDTGRFAQLRLVAWTDTKSNLVNFLPVIEPHPPTLGGIDVYFRYAAPTSPPEHAVALNDCAWADVTPALQWPGPTFEPYRPCSDTAPTLYLGFDAPLPAERIGVFLEIGERPDGAPLDVRCEAFDGEAFRPLVVEDGTRGFTVSGILHLVWPGEEEGLGALVVQAAGTDVLLAEAGAARRYAPGTVLWLADERGGELVTAAAAADRELTLVRPVARSYAGASLRAAPPARFGRPLSWLRLVFPADAEPPEVSVVAVLANAVMAANVVTVTGEILGGSDGSPGQVLFVRRSPLLAGETVEVRELDGARAAVDALILRDELAVEGRLADYRPTTDPSTGRVSEVWVRWQVRDTLAFSDPGARDCMIDRVRGRVLFGDGVFGRVPAAGRDNVRIGYRAAGDGPDGNLPAGAITSVLSGVLARGVTNVLPAQGGAAGETLDRFRRRGPTVLRHRNQVLTASDYESLAYEASAAVARARALGATDADGRIVPGRVRLVIVPDGREPAPVPTGELRRQVSDLISARMPLTIGRGLTVVGPRYAEIGVDAVVRPRRPEAAGTLRETVRGAIADFLHPVLGGPGGDGFAFGASISASDLARELAVLADLDALAELAFVVDAVPAGERVALAPDRLPTAGRIRVVVTERA
jgi:predicted phage baseplate assembly protein